MNGQSDDRRCGTCARWIYKMEDGIPANYCEISLKPRYRNDMKGCLAWKRQKIVFDFERRGGGNEGSV